jgi:curved DNA-binding protein
MNEYKLLGISPSSTKEERETAWKKLRSKHHPDKGGDAEKFKQLKEAYEKIKDLPPMTDSQYERTVRSENIYSGKGWFHDRRPSRYINIDADISIQKAVNGGQYTLLIQLANHAEFYNIEVDVPPGVGNGETINYPRLLLASIDVLVTFHIQNDAVWSMDGLNLTRIEKFSIWDLIIGTTRDVPTIHGTKVRVTIPPMTQPGTKLRLKSHGAHSRQNYLHKGDMFVKVEATIPTDIPDDLLTQIKEIRG